MTHAAGLVSVILPTYNRAATLGRAMASVLAQAYPSLELIVVDDGSTDGTAAVVERCADPRVRYLRRANGGPGAARNAGIAAARGEFIAFQDSDDEWLPGKLAKQVAALQAAPADVGVMLCGSRELRPDKVTEVTTDEFIERGDGAGSLLTGLWYVPPTWLVRRTALAAAGGFDEALPSCEDWDLAFRLSDVCRFACVPEILVQKHHTRGSVFDHPAGRVDGFRIVLERHRARWRRSPAWLSRQEFVLGWWHLAELRRRATGLRYMLLAAWHGPAARAREALTQAAWHLLPGRLRTRLWRHPAVRRAFSVYAAEQLGAPPRKPVARIFTPAPLDPAYPNGFSDRWFHFIRALSERFEVEVVAVRGIWAPLAIDPDAMRPPMQLRSFRVFDAEPYRKPPPAPFHFFTHTLAQLNTHRTGPRADAARAALAPAPHLTIFLTHFLAHLAFRLPPEAPCLFVLEEGLVRMEHVNLPAPTASVRLRKLWRAWKQWLATWRYSRFIRRCGARGPVVAISEVEREWFSRWIPAERIRAIGLGLDPGAFAPGPAAPDFDVAVFGDLGQSRNYEPTAELLARAQGRDDTRGLRWLLVGRDPAPVLRAFAAPNVVLTGDVADTREHYPRARVVVVPARVVTGSKTTLLKAWAMGRPVVASVQSAAGIPARPDDNMLVADGTDGLLDAILRLLRDPALAARVAAAGRRTIEEECNQNRQAASFAEYCVAAAGPVALPVTLP